MSIAMIFPVVIQSNKHVVIDVLGIGVVSHPILAIGLDAPRSRTNKTFAGHGGESRVKRGGL